MKRRKILIIVLSLILCFVFSSNAFAADGYYIYEDIFVNAIKLDKTYHYIDFDLNDGCVITEFKTPAKGKITLNLSDASGSLNYSSYFLFATNLMEEDSLIADIEPTVKYDSKSNKYTYSKTISVPKGKCYLIIYNEEDKDFTFNLGYTPTFSGTDIARISAKKRGFIVKCKKANAATGYQIRYSRSRKMTKAKMISTTKLFRTVSKLKARKKYYVQVRSYKRVKVNDKYKIYYSKWSKIRAIRTR